MHQHSERAADWRPAENVRSIPNLFVVGAAKSGTTTLYKLFATHPEIYVPESIKETKFMAYEGQMPSLNGPGDKVHGTARSVIVLDRYMELYSGWDSQRYAADVSPVYLPSGRAVTRIRTYRPDAKIVMILRNPIEAAYSMFVMLRRDGRERQRSFVKAFEASEKRIALGWEDAWNLKRYDYATQVGRYMDAFDRSQLFTRRYEDLRDTPAQFFSSLGEFLGLRTPFDYAGVRANVAPDRLRELRSNPVAGRILKIPKLRRTIPAPVKNALRDWLKAPAYSIRPDEYNHALAHYGEDIRNLGDLLNWDVSSWLERR